MSVTQPVTMPVEKQVTLLTAFCVALLHEKSLDGKLGKVLRALADEAHKGHEGNLMECQKELCKNAAKLLYECSAKEANFCLHELTDLKKDYQLRTNSPILGTLHICLEQGAKSTIIQV